MARLLLFFLLTTVSLHCFAKLTKNDSPWRIQHMGPTSDLYGKHMRALVSRANMRPFKSGYHILRSHKYSASGGRNRLRTQFFERQLQTAEVSAVERSRIVNNYFTDSGWVRSLNESPSASAPNGQSQTPQVPPRSQVSPSPGRPAPSSNYRSSYFRVPADTGYNVQSLSPQSNNQQPAAPLLVSSYTSYEPANTIPSFSGQPDKLKSFKNVGTKAEKTKSLAKTWLPVLLTSFLMTGLTFGGLAYAYTLNPPTTISYSRRHWLRDPIETAAPVQSNNISGVSAGKFLKGLWKKVLPNFSKKSDRKSKLTCQSFCHTLRAAKRLRSRGSYLKQLRKQIQKSNRAQLSRLKAPTLDCNELGCR